MEVEPSDSPERNLNPPLVDDRSTKKTKFREDLHSENLPQAPLSFRDTLMAAKDMNIEQRPELVLAEDDVTFDDSGKMAYIAFSQRVHEHVEKPWRTSVIVKLLGRKIGYKVLYNRLKLLWPTPFGFSVVDLGNEFHLVKFRTEEDTETALTNGPYAIFGHCLSVQPWVSNFNSATAEIKSVVAWIRLPGLPIAFYDKVTLRRIGQILGQVIRIDYNTMSSERGKYARLAVKLDLSKPLRSQFSFEGQVIRIEYENLPLICYQCGKFGHYREVCPELLVDNSNDGLSHQKARAASSIGPSAGVSEEPSFGSWMVVPRRNRSKNTKVKDDKSVTRISPSEPQGQKAQVRTNGDKDGAVREFKPRFTRLEKGKAVVPLNSDSDSKDGKIGSRFNVLIDDDDTNKYSKNVILAPDSLEVEPNPMVVPTDGRKDRVKKHSRKSVGLNPKPTLKAQAQVFKTKTKTTPKRDSPRLQVYQRSRGLRDSVKDVAYPISNETSTHATNSEKPQSFVAMPQHVPVTLDPFKHSAVSFSTYTTDTPGLNNKITLDPINHEPPDIAIHSNDIHLGLDPGTQFVGEDPETQIVCEDPLPSHNLSPAPSGSSSEFVVQDTGMDKDREDS